jgi:hypothetical protein
MKQTSQVLSAPNLFESSAKDVFPVVSLKPSDDEIAPGDRLK